MRTKTRRRVEASPSKRVCAMQQRWMISLGTVLAAMCLTGCTRRHGTVVEILIALVALYMVLSRLVLDTKKNSHTPGSQPAKIAGEIVVEPLMLVLCLGALSGAAIKAQHHFTNLSLDEASLYQFELATAVILIGAISLLGGCGRREAPALS